MMWGYGHDWGMTGGWGGGAFNMIIWPLVLVALVIGVIWFIRSPSYSGAGRSRHGAHLVSIFSKSAMRAEKSIATNFCKRNKKFLVEAAFQWNSHRFKQGDQACRNEPLLLLGLPALSRLQL